MFMHPGKEVEQKVFMHPGKEVLQKVFMHPGKEVEQKGAQRAPVREFLSSVVATNVPILSTCLFFYINLFAAYLIIM